MRTKQSYFQNVNPAVRLQPTPDHLRLDRERFDAGLESGRASGISTASRLLRSVQDLDEHFANLRRQVWDWSAAEVAAEPTKESASTAYQGETWQDRERAALQVQNDRMVDLYLQQVHEGHSVQGNSGRSRVTRAFKKPPRVELKRMVGGHQGLPPWLRKLMTQGQQSVTIVILGQFRRFGRCELCNANIAAMAGVSKATVYYTKLLLRKLGVVKCQERRIANDRSLPTVIRFVGESILEWIRKGPAGGWSQKVNNNKSLSTFFVRPCNSEVVKSSDDPEPNTFRGAALCRESG